MLPPWISIRSPILLPNFSRLLPNSYKPQKPTVPSQHLHVLVRTSEMLSSRHSVDTTTCYNLWVSYNLSRIYQFPQSFHIHSEHTSHAKIRRTYLIRVFNLVRWLLVPQVTDENPLESSVLQRIRDICSTLAGIVYLALGNVDPGEDPGFDFARFPWEPEEWDDLLKICVNIFATTYDCSPRRLEHLTQAVDLIDSNQPPGFPLCRDTVYLRPVFDAEALPATCSETETWTNTTAYSLFQQAIVADFRLQAMECRRRITWTRRFVRQIMSGLGNGLKVSLASGNLLDEDAFTPIFVIRGLRGVEIVDDFMEIVGFFH